MNFYNLFVLFILVSLSNSIDGLWTKTEGYNYVMGTEYFYKLHTVPNDLENAKVICEGEGAIVFYPDTKSEVDAVMSYLYKNVNDTSVPPSFLIGLERSSSGDFKTVDGIPASDVYTNWIPGEPNNDNGGESCVEMYHFGNGTVTMNDIVNKTALTFICKVHIKHTKWNKRCNMPYTEYGFAEQVGKCYKLHLSPKSWAEARNTCREENSDLAVINSRQELDYLVKLTDSIPKIRIPGLFMHGIVLLGFHRLTSENWETVDGTTLYDSGYACWGNSQPDGVDRQRCGSMYYNGHLNDIECDQKSFFICEHNIDTRYYAYEPPPQIPTRESLHCYDDI